MDTTTHDLKLLSIGYYIQGGLTVGYALLFLAWVAFVGASFAAGIAGQRASSPPPQQVTGILAPAGVFIALMMLLGLLSGLAQIYAGWALRKYKHRTLMLVIAAMTCLAFPYGTVLGIFTFAVLLRPSADRLFGVPTGGVPVSSQAQAPFVTPTVE
jgi:hypothetical protein